jgi:NAD-dependent deacetylase sirtuin 5
MSGLDILFQSLQDVHGSPFSVKCGNAKCDHFEVENRMYPIIPALHLPKSLDVSGPAVPLPVVDEEQLPHFPKCNHLLLPAVIWFSEALPEQVLLRIDNWMFAEKVDLILIIGTRVYVWLATYYTHTARGLGAREAIVNMEEPDEEHDFEYDWLFGGGAAEIVPELLKEVFGITPELGAMSRWA